MFCYSSLPTRMSSATTRAQRGDRLSRLANCYSRTCSCGSWRALTAGSPGTSVGAIERNVGSVREPARRRETIWRGRIKRPRALKVRVARASRDRGARLQRDVVFAYSGLSSQATEKCPLSPRGARPGERSEPRLASPWDGRAERPSNAVVRGAVEVSTHRIVVAALTAVSMPPRRCFSADCCKGSNGLPDRATFCRECVKVPESFWFDRQGRKEWAKKYKVKVGYCRPYERTAPQLGGGQRMGRKRQRNQMAGAEAPQTVVTATGRSQRSSSTRSSCRGSRCTRST